MKEMYYDNYIVNLVYWIIGYIFTMIVFIGFDINSYILSYDDKDKLKKISTTLLSTLEEYRKK